MQQLNLKNQSQKMKNTKFKTNAVKPWYILDFIGQACQRTSCHDGIEQTNLITEIYQGFTADKRNKANTNKGMLRSSYGLRQRKIERLQGKSEKLSIQSKTEKIKASKSKDVKIELQTKVEKVKGYRASQKKYKNVSTE